MGTIRINVEETAADFANFIGVCYFVIGLLVLFAIVSVCFSVIDRIKEEQKKNDEFNSVLYRSSGGHDNSDSSSRKRSRRSKKSIRRSSTSKRGGNGE